MSGMSDKNGGYSSGSSHASGSEERRSHRAYRDPTADTAIANVMREERMKRRIEEQVRKRREKSIRKNHTRKEQKAASLKQDGGGALYAEK